MDLRLKESYVMIRAGILYLSPGVWFLRSFRDRGKVLMKEITHHIHPAKKIQNKTAQVHERPLTIIPRAR